MKDRKIINYDSINESLKKQIYKDYPNGFFHLALKIPKADGSYFHAFTYDTSDCVYLIKLNEHWMKSPDDMLNEIEEYRPELGTDFED